MRLSAIQVAVLRNVLKGLPSTTGLIGRSARGAHSQVLASLRRRGLLDEHNEITPRGRELANINYHPPRTP